MDTIILSRADSSACIRGEPEGTLEKARDKAGPLVL